MTRRKQVLIAALAAAVLLSVSYLAVRPAAEPAGVPVPVLVADVPEGTAIEASMLALVRMSAERVPPDAVLSVEEAVGLRAAVPLFKGETLLRGRIAAEAKGLPHPGAETGRRIYALALKAEDAGGWWLSEGSRVDVHLLPVRSDGAGTQEVLAGIRVAGLMDNKGNRLGSGSEGAAPSILCLDVDAAQAYRLAEAEAEGRIKVVIVNETME